MGTTKQRWAKGQYENEVRITVRCKQDENHAKILRFDAKEISYEMAKAMAEVFRGEGPAFILRPGPSCPVGKCAVCGGELSAITERVSHAQRSQSLNRFGK